MNLTVSIPTPATDVAPGDTIWVDEQNKWMEVDESRRVRADDGTLGVELYMDTGTKTRHVLRVHPARGIEVMPNPKMAGALALCIASYLGKGWQVHYTNTEDERLWANHFDADGLWWDGQIMNRIADTKLDEALAVISEACWQLQVGIGDVEAGDPRQPADARKLGAVISEVIDRLYALEALAAIHTSRVDERREAIRAGDSAVTPLARQVAVRDHAAKVRDTNARNDPLPAVLIQPAGCCPESLELIEQCPLPHEHVLVSSAASDQVDPDATLAQIAHSAAVAPSGGDADL